MPARDHGAHAYAGDALTGHKQHTVTHCTVLWRAGQARGAGVAECGAHQEREGASVQGMGGRTLEELEGFESTGLARAASSLGHNGTHLGDVDIVLPSATPHSTHMPRTHLKISLASSCHLLPSPAIP